MMVTIYFIPTIIAIIKNKKHRLVIMILNLFFGWTFILWIVALIWAMWSKREEFQHQELTSYRYVEIDSEKNPPFDGQNNRFS